MMKCPLCGSNMGVFKEGFRCSKTDFHKGKSVIITGGVIKFKGSVLQRGEDIEKSHIIIVTTTSNEKANNIVNNSQITVYSAPDMVVDSDPNMNSIIERAMRRSDDICGSCGNPL